MGEVTLQYRNSEILLTRRNAEQLDRVIVHMRNKPEMRIVASHTTYDRPELILERLAIVKAYMKKKTEITLKQLWETKDYLGILNKSGKQPE